MSLPSSFLSILLLAEHFQSVLLSSTHRLSFRQLVFTIHFSLPSFWLEKCTEHGNFVILQSPFYFYSSRTPLRLSFVPSVPSSKMTMSTGLENGQMSLPWIFEVRRRSSGVAQVSCGGSADFARTSPNFPVSRSIRRYSRKLYLVHAGRVREYRYNGEILWHAQIGQLYRS